MYIKNNIKKLDISNFTESRLGSMQLQSNKHATDNNPSAMRSDESNFMQQTQTKPKFKIPARNTNITFQPYTHKTLGFIIL